MLLEHFFCSLGCGNIDNARGINSSISFLISKFILQDGWNDIGILNFAFYIFYIKIMDFYKFTVFFVQYVIFLQEKQYKMQFLLFTYLLFDDIIKAKQWKGVLSDDS